MKKVLVLGHNGMLGNVVCKYLSTKKEKYTIITTEGRWGSEFFNENLANIDADVIINCIGIIPQKKPTIDDYKRINFDLPVFLETLGKKIIHPSTDCEFSGRIENNKKYTKKDLRDAEDDYGRSKAEISKIIEKDFKNTKIIRTSIIGHEENSKVALLDWFLNQTNSVNGYTNHYWNGVTTLEWVKLCEDIIDNWTNFPQLNQYGTKDIRSKYELLNNIKNVYSKDITINPFEAADGVNKCLESDKEIKPISEQLLELRSFYKR